MFRYNHRQIVFAVVFELIPDVEETSNERNNLIVGHKE